MSRNNLSGSRTRVIEINEFKGENTIKAFNKIDIRESRRMLNMLPRSMGGLSKRPGTAPITNPAPETGYTDGELSTICNLYKDNTNTVLVVSYKQLLSVTPETGTYYGIKMNVPFTTPHIDYAQFKDESGKEVLVLADGGNLKVFNGFDVSEITPAANDGSPLPANDLTNINTHKPTGCLVHNTRVVLWNGSDTIWHSKIGYYDYYPQVDFQRFVRENDKIQTCISYRGALVVLMRRHIGILFGHDRENWSQDFLDTTNGCLAPKSVQTVVFPDGKQEVFYVSDDGVHSIYTINTISQDASARYSTKNVTKTQIDWKALNVTEEEWAGAVAHFYKGMYWLIYKTGGVYKGFVFDTVTESWYPISDIKANDFYSDGQTFYYVGPEKRLKVIDDSLYVDYINKDRTLSNPIMAHWYSTLLNPRETGHDHFWDILMVEAKQFPVDSTVDVEVNTYNEQYSKPSAIKTATLIWGETKWGESQWHNENLTDAINHAKRLRTFVKGQYAQIKLSNNRKEPMEILGIKYEIRTMDTYY